MRQVCLRLFACVSLAVGLSLAVSPAWACRGDCNFDCGVTVDEILTLVNGGLGELPVSSCLAGDSDLNRSITIDEILTGVNNALQGCGGPPCQPAVETKCNVPAGEGVNFDPTDESCQFLSSYRFFKGSGALQIPNDGVVPFDLNTILFSDFTLKHRFVWLPPGTNATYDEQQSFNFPVGTVIIKTFAYPADQTNPSTAQDVLETRLMVRRAEGWAGLPYVWNQDKSDAVLKIVGATLTVSGVQLDGEMGTFQYSVPNSNQCKECHKEHDEIMNVLGPKARHLNRDYAYADGEENQLVKWTELGILRGAPADPNDAPRAAVFDDPSTGDIEARARTYLDINCAHCHNESGAARTTGFWVNIQETDPGHLGICKSPTAAGPGTGGFGRVIDPGHPETSIVPFRMNSIEPEIAMPELGRRRIHGEAVDVITEWIASMEEGCE